MGHHIRGGVVVGVCVGVSGGGVGLPSVFHASCLGPGFVCTSRAVRELEKAWVAMSRGFESRN